MSAAALESLHSVKVGDIIFGIAGGAQEKLLFVYDADADGFSARHVFSQTKVRFGRDGESRWAEGGGSCTIVSTARLPADMFAAALGLDRRFAARPDYPDSILTKEEIGFVLNHDKFFRAHLLPGKEAIVRRAERINEIRAVLQSDWDPIDAQGDPPGWNEYLEDLPDLLELSESRASTAAVESFLIAMAARAGRTRQIGMRSAAVALSLVRLRDRWT